MEKEFDELTIADDYMFYRVMEDPEICKTLLNRVLQGKVETITEIELQKTIDDAGRAKGVRFDVWAKDCKGNIYDIEMQAIDKKDLAKRIPRFQANTDNGLRIAHIQAFDRFDYFGIGRGHRQYGGRKDIATQFVDNFESLPITGILKNPDSDYCKKHDGGE